MGAANIETGANGFFPSSWAVAPDGKLIRVDGISRGSIWNGLTSAPYDLGIDAPAAAPTVTTPVGGAATAGTYYCAFRYIDADGIPSSLSPIATVTAVANDKFEYADLTASANTRIPTSSSKQIWRSLADEPEVMYLVTTMANGTTTYTADTLSDATLALNTKMAVLTPEGNENANQFTIPPTFMSAVAVFQDRAFYAVPVKYTQGTIGVSNGGTTVTGTGTNWTSAMAGWYFYREGDTQGYLISAASASSLTIPAYAGSTVASGASYVVRPHPKYRRWIFYSSIWDPDLGTGPEAVSEFNVIPVQENTGGDDELTGLMPMGGYLYVLCERMLLLLSFARQPNIDPSANTVPVANRGCLNQRTWCIAEGTAYLMDQFGIYALQGRSVRDISEPIADLWRDGTIDYSKAKWFFARAVPTDGYVEFHVAYAGDSDDTPKRGLRYCYRTESWSPVTYPWALGGAAVTTISGRSRQVLGGEDDCLYIGDAGNLDGLNSETETGTLTGTVTATDATSITDGTATFPTAAATAKVMIYFLDGAAKGTGARCTVRTSATKLTVASWPTQPAIGDTYQIAGIPWDTRFGAYPIRSGENVVRRSLATVTEPLSAGTFDARLYEDRDDDPRDWGVTVSSEGGDGVESEEDDPDAVADATKESGYHRFRFDDPSPRDADGEVYISPQLRGISGAEGVRIYEVELVGIGDEEE